jgi:hypothetical protein
LPAPKPNHAHHENLGTLALAHFYGHTSILIGDEQYSLGSGDKANSTIYIVAAQSTMDFYQANRTLVALGSDYDYSDCHTSFERRKSHRQKAQTKNRTYKMQLQ